LGELETAEDKGECTGLQKAFLEGTTHMQARLPAMNVSLLKIGSISLQDRQ